MGTIVGIDEKDHLNDNDQTPLFAATADPSGKKQNLGCISGLVYPPGYKRRTSDPRERFPERRWFANTYP